MPWKECKPMDERLRFIARLLEGEKMAMKRSLSLSGDLTRLSITQIFDGRRYEETPFTESFVVIDT